MDDFIKAFEAGIDRTLLRENLRLTPQQRFDKFDAFMHGVMELKQAGERHRTQQALLASKLIVDAAVPSINQR